jgi:hypothetical protein
MILAIGTKLVNKKPFDGAPIGTTFTVDSFRKRDSTFTLKYRYRGGGNEYLQHLSISEIRENFDFKSGPIGFPFI